MQCLRFSGVHSDGSCRSRALGKMQVAMLVSLVLFIVGVPATGKYQRVCKVVLEIGYPAALVLFGIFHRRKLTESGKMLFQAYLSYWNKQYGTNYMTGAGTEIGILICWRFYWQLLCC